MFLIITGVVQWCLKTAKVALQGPKRTTFLNSHIKPSSLVAQKLPEMRPPPGPVIMI